MKVLAEIQVIPLGEGVSVRPRVQRAHDLIVASGLVRQDHAYGTNVEGSIDEVLALIKTIHETLHAEGVVRIASSIKLGSRTDKQPRLSDKRLEDSDRG